MPGDGRGIERIEPGHGAQQGKGHKRDGKGQRHPGRDGDEEIGGDAVGRQAGAAFEANGQKQVERHEPGRALGDRKVRADKGGKQPQSEKQDRGYQQAAGQRVENMRHGPPVS